MNKGVISFIKNFSYTLVSNVLSMVVSTLVVLLVPRLIGGEEYGYWQLYLFYSSYVGFLHFGWIDGIYLRYGGKEYKDLDKRLFFSQFYMLAILQTIIAVVIIILSIALLKDNNRIYVFQATAICLLFTNVRYMLLYILQCTNRIKEFAQNTILDRALYCCLIVVFLIFGAREYKLMIVADLGSKLISLINAMYYCKDIVFNKFSKFYFDYKETIENINVGIKLMFANIASMLIIGIVRFGIERSWDVAIFGKVSLTLNISNLMMLFINAVGIILFPILRRVDEDKLSNIYIYMRDCLMAVMLGALVVYYPLRVALSMWLPNYADTLIYMALLFPISVYEGKMALLINTYLKTMRLEKMMLKINVVSMILSLVFALMTTQIFKNLPLAILSIVILLAFRSVFAEAYLSKLLHISILKDVALELGLTVTFILAGWFVDSWHSVLVYGLAFVIYVSIKKTDLLYTIGNVRSLVKS